MTDMYIIMTPKGFPVYICDSLENAKKLFKIGMNKDNFQYYILDETMQNFEKFEEIPKGCNFCISKNCVLDETKKPIYIKKMSDTKYYETESVCDSTFYKCEFYNENCYGCNNPVIYSYNFEIKHVVADIWERCILYDTKELVLPENLPENLKDWKSEFKK